MLERCLWEGETIVRDCLFVPVETLLWGALQSPIIRAGETETLTVPFGPFEVVNDCPYKVSIKPYPFFDSSIRREHVVPRIGYAIVVLNFAVSFHVVFEGSPVFCDVEHWIVVLLS